MTHQSMNAVLHGLSDGFLTLDEDWRITFANREARRLCGSAGDDPTGRKVWELPPFDREPELEADCRRAAAEGEPFDHDLRWPGDGEWRRVRLAYAPDGMAMYITDITERRRRRAVRLAVEAAEAERTARLEEMIRALADTVTVQDVVDALGERVLPPLGADGLIIGFAAGDRLRLVGSIGYPPEFRRRAANWPLTADAPLAEVFRTNTPIFVETAEEFRSRYRDLQELPGMTGRAAWAYLPLLVSGRVIGSCLLGWSYPRRFSAAERNLLVALSGLLAQTLERARLYDVEHNRAQQLQRGLLPRTLPSLPAVATAARYLPAGQDMEVGGDWYDVIPLSAERVALVIGDVMGHGVSEAATMGRLRTAVHTLADLELPPDELLTHLNDLVNDLGEDFYVSCLYAVYDPVTRECVLARAGHPPPAIAYPDGTVRFAEPTANPPLGAAGPPFDPLRIRLPEGSLLVFYTDGLVESATREIDDGMAELAFVLAGPAARLVTTPWPEDGQSAAEHGKPVLERLCDVVTSALLPAPLPTADDTALLIARTRALSTDEVATWALPDDPTAAGLARDYAGAQLGAWGLDELAPTTELLVSELVGNVIRHAKGPVYLRLLRGRVLTCEVADGSLTTPRIRRPTETDEGGRGLQLVAALAHRWGTRYKAAGKCIWTEQLLPSPPLTR